MMTLLNRIIKRIIPQTYKCDQKQHYLMCFQVFSRIHIHWDIRQSRDIYKGASYGFDGGEYRLEADVDCQCV